MHFYWVRKIHLIWMFYLLHDFIEICYLWVKFLAESADFSIFYWNSNFIFYAEVYFLLIFISLLFLFDLSFFHECSDKISDFLHSDCHLLSLIFVQLLFCCTWSHVRLSVKKDSWLIIKLYLEKKRFVDLWNNMTAAKFTINSSFNQSFW